MIDAEAGVVEHAERDRDERGEQHLARGADVIAEQHHHRERDREVIGVALLEAERARLEAQRVLEEPGAENGRGAGNRDCNRRRGDRPRADGADADLAHAAARSGSVSRAIARSCRRTQSSPQTRCAPLPLVGRGWGWGSVFEETSRATTTTPLPTPPPQGGREQTELAA